MSDADLLSAILADPGPAESGDTISAAVVSRICHDLVSPLGAFANGVELLALSGVRNCPEMDLIAQSVDSVAARMRFFRLAYGAAAPGQAAKRSEVVETLRGLSRSGRLAYAWDVAEDRPRLEVKAAYLLLQCLESAMPLGGRIQVSCEGDVWTISAEGSRIRLDEPLWRALETGPTAGPGTPGLVQFALLPPALAALGRRLSLELAPGRIEARY